MDTRKSRERKRHDFAESQFAKPIEYVDIVSSREEAFSDTNADQYDYLRQSVFNQINQFRETP